MKQPTYMAERPLEIVASMSKFEDFCQSCKSFPNEELRLTGTANDLSLLNWCEYETGYPGEDWVVGAHVWANLIVSVGSASWAKGENSELYLVSPLASDGWNRWRFEVLPMYKHFQLNEYVQWGAVDTLTQFFMVHVLFGGGELSDLKGVIQLWRDRNNEMEDEGSIFKLLHSSSRVLSRLTESRENRITSNGSRPR